MKDASQIIAEAPVSSLYGFKLAFVCSSCPWWAHDWNIPRRDEKGLLHCLQCDSLLKELPLEALIISTRDENPQNFDAFIGYNAANTGVRKESP